MKLHKIFHNAKAGVKTYILFAKLFKNKKVVTEEYEYDTLWSMVVAASFWEFPLASWLIK